ncbi:MAG: DUF4097 family beta strand repeat protein [Acidobacteria bacterium]|nr:DUF4097 family beta strand repeat protein [Acidobacteriota bacterium]
MKLARPSLLLLLISLLANAASAKTWEKTFDQTWHAREGARLIVENENGSIHVASWDRDEIRVKAILGLDARDDEDGQQAFDSLRVRVRESADSLEIGVERPREKSGFLSWFFGDSYDSEVQFEVMVPRRYDVSASTVNGRVEARSLHGDLRFDTINGRINVSGSSGSVSADSVNGRIEVELVSVDPGASMKFGTVNGRVRLSLPAYARVTLDASTTNGSIDTEIPVATRKFSRNRLQGDLNGGGAMVRIQTVNGGVDILSN